MVLREARAFSCRSAINRSAYLFRDGNATPPGAGLFDFSTVHKNGILRAVDLFSELLETFRIGANPVTDSTNVRGAQSSLVPVVEGDRNIDGTRRRLKSKRVRAHDCAWHILSPLWLVRPLNVRPWQHGFIAGGEKRIADNHFSGLLPSCDDERSLVLESGHDVAHAVTRACRSVQVDEGGLARSLGKSIGHCHCGCFLETENVVEIRREILQEWLFGRTRIPEDRRQSQRSQQVVGRGPHCLLFVCRHDVSFSEAAVRLSAAIPQRLWASN